MWDLWWPKWHWCRFFSESFDFSPPVSIHRSSIFTHTSLGYGQRGPLEDQFHRDIVPQHRNNNCVWWYRRMRRRSAMKLSIPIVNLKIRLGLPNKAGNLVTARLGFHCKKGAGVSPERQQLNYVVTSDFWADHHINGYARVPLVLNKETQNVSKTASCMCNLVSLCDTLLNTLFPVCMHSIIIFNFVRPAH
jgi:hypothetical protein